MSKKDLDFEPLNPSDKEKMDNYYDNKRFNQMQRDERNKKFGVFSTVIKIFILFQLILILVSMLQGNLRFPSFTSLLKGLSEFDVIPSIPFITFTEHTLGDWTVNIWESFELFPGINFPAFSISFNWLRSVFGWLLNIINVLVFLVNGTISNINFAIFFTRWIFLG